MEKSKTNGSYDLIIVESPTKVRTLSKLLGKKFKVKASVGHVRDLPQKSLGIEISDEFKPKYTMIRGKGKIVKELKASAVNARKVILAADPDREGEAICWHLSKLLGLDEREVSRILIFEITRSGVKRALENMGEINLNKVNAQQARRILDRLVGYKVSPLLWKVIGKGLSAGRVQTVALRLINEREEKRESFHPEEYWTLDAIVKKPGGKEFSSRLEKINGKKAEIKNEAEMNEILKDLKGVSYLVSGVTRKEKKRSAPPPLITSTLQQEASSRFRLTPRRTMAVAQKLYEGMDLPGVGRTGLITYMRTDSVRLSDESINSVRQFIKET